MKLFPTAFVGVCGSRVHIAAARRGINSNRDTSTVCGLSLNRPSFGSICTPSMMNRIRGVVVGLYDTSYAVPWIKSGNSCLIHSGAIIAGFHAPATTKLQRWIASLLTTQTLSADFFALANAHLDFGCGTLIRDSRIGRLNLRGCNGESGRENGV